MRVDVSGHLFVFPHDCACCGGTADAELSVSASRSRGSRIVHTEMKTWDVPYCSGCIKHIRNLDNVRLQLKLLAFFSLFLGLLIGFSLGSYWGAVAGMLALVATALLHRSRLRQLRAECSAGSCVSIDKAVEYPRMAGDTTQV